MRSLSVGMSSRLKSRDGRASLVSCAYAGEKNVNRKSAANRSIHTFSAVSTRWIRRGREICLECQVSCSSLKKPSQIVSPKQTKANKSPANHQLHAAAAVSRALKKETNAAKSAARISQAPTCAGKYFTPMVG